MVFSIGHSFISCLFFPLFFVLSSLFVCVCLSVRMRMALCMSCAVVGYIYISIFRQSGKCHRLYFFFACACFLFDGLKFR